VIDGTVELDFKEEVDALRLENFEGYFEKAGLDILHIYGNYNLDSFDDTTSDRLIIVAKNGFDV